jgi:hypothetical protein
LDVSNYTISSSGVLLIKKGKSKTSTHSLTGENIYNSSSSASIDNFTISARVEYKTVPNEYSNVLKGSNGVITYWDRLESFKADDSLTDSTAFIFSVDNVEKATVNIKVRAVVIKDTTMSNNYSSSYVFRDQNY